MNVKYTSIILLGLFGSVLCSISEDNVQKWLDDIINKHWESCKNKISDENFQLMKDNIETDNGEIRAFELCLAIHCGYMVEKKINTEKIMNEFSYHVENMGAEEKELAIKMLDNCKEEGQLEQTEIDVFGKFTGCVIDRCKSGL